jgi:hypothetical protein
MFPSRAGLVAVIAPVDPNGYERLASGRVAASVKSVVWRHAMEDSLRPSDPAVPEADALEQKRAWAEEDELDEVRLPPDVPDNDALDQARPVPLEDEDR